MTTLHPYHLTVFLCSAYFVWFPALNKLFAANLFWSLWPAFVKLKWSSKLLLGTKTFVLYFLANPLTYEGHISKTTAVINLKGSVDVMISPLMLEALQRYVFTNRNTSTEKLMCLITWRFICSIADNVYFVIFVLYIQKQKLHVTFKWISHVGLSSRVLILLYSSYSSYLAGCWRPSYSMLCLCCSCHLPCNFKFFLFLGETFISS